MTNNTQKKICLCCYVALAFCGVYTVFMALHFIQLLNGKNDIDWLQNGITKKNKLKIIIL